MTDANKLAPRLCVFPVGKARHLLPKIASPCAANAQAPHVSAGVLLLLLCADQADDVAAAQRRALQAKNAGMAVWCWLLLPAGAMPFSHTPPHLHALTQACHAWLPLPAENGDYALGKARQYLQNIQNQLNSAFGVHIQGLAACIGGTGLGLILNASASAGQQAMTKAAAWQEQLWGAVAQQAFSQLAKQNQPSLLAECSILLLHCPRGRTKLATINKILTAVNRTVVSSNRFLVGVAYHDEVHEQLDVQVFLFGVGTGDRPLDSD